MAKIYDQHKFKETYYYRGTWLQLIRPLTLTGTITPILVGTGYAYHEGDFKIIFFIVFLFTAIVIQIVINMLNDYFDFLNGQDSEKWLLTDGNNEPTHIQLTDVPKVACLLTGIASITGIWLALQTNLSLIPIGMISIVAGIKYSAGKRSLAAIALGEITAFICLGIIVTTVAYFIQTNYLTLNILLVSIVFGLLIVTMILTNNIYDIVKDEPHRITLAILLGRKRALYFLVIVIILLYSTIIYMIIKHMLNITSLLTLMSVPIALKLIDELSRPKQKTNKKRVMFWAALHHFLFGILLAITVWF